jgi:hypothetical protein
MKTFKIKAVIPASRVETFVIEANTPEEAYKMLMENGGRLITSETTLHREDTEYDYPQEI